MKGRIVANRAASILIAIGLLMSSFAGVVILMVSSNEVQASLPSDYSNGDRIIGSDYTVKSWNITSTYTMNGNLTIRDGGVVTVTGGGLVFAENIGGDRTAGTADDRIYTLIIEDGGKLVLSNSTLSTNLNQLNAFPSLAVMVRNGGTLEAYDSVLSFPGHMIVDDSTLTMWRSSITGNDQVGSFCNETYFPESSYGYAPVLLFMSSTVNIYDSSLPNIYQTPDADTPFLDQIYLGMYDHSYPFVADNDNDTTGAREAADYYLSRMPSAKASNDTTGSDLDSLLRSDLEYYAVANTKTMWLDGFDSGGLVFNAADNVQATLYVQYYTGNTYSSSSKVLYQYENGAVGSTTMTFSNTAVNPVTGTADQVVASAALPSMSSLDLSGLNIGFSNNGGQTLYINKVWITFKITLPTYTSITLAGNTQFTAVNSMIGVDFSDKENHNTMVLRDNSMAYLYGITLDPDAEKEPTTIANRQPAFVTVEKTVTSIVSDKTAVVDTTGSAISGVTAKDSSYYTVPYGTTLSLYNFNTSDLSGPISGASLVFDYSANTYTGSNYVKYSVNGGGLTNTNIQVAQTTHEIAPEFDLYSQGVDSIEDIKTIVIQTVNNGASGQFFAVNCVWINITLSPTINIYRWANVTVSDVQSLPVNGAVVSSVIESSGVPAYYNTPAGVQNYPSSEVLQYLNKNSNTYNVTDNEGKAKIPLLSEVLDPKNPNPYAAFAYEMTVTYENTTGSLFMNSTGVSFQPYPDMTSGNTWKQINVTLPSLALELPDLVVLPITVTPLTAYEGDSIQISATVHNRGKTTATKVQVSIVGYVGGTNAAFWNNQTIETIAIGSENDYTLSTVTWSNVPAGTHTISVFIDPERKISEESKTNNVMSKQFTVLKNLAELSITSADISFSPQPASSIETVTATIYVNNTGRASANNVTVDLYAGNAQSGGLYIGSTVLTVSTGSFTQTTYTWTPSQIGTYPIYVYVNSNHNVEEYDYTNNVAYKSLTVNIASTGSDLVIGETQYPTLTITGPNAFNWAYNVLVVNDGVLTITNTAFTEVQSSSYQLKIIVKDDATLRLISGTSLNSNLHIDLYLMDNANLTVIGSTISSAVHIRADDNATVYITSSTVAGDLVTPATSYAHVVAVDTNFGQSWSSFGGQAKAYVTNISIPSLNPKDSATIYHYRWVKVVVLDGTGERLSGADVSIFHPVNGAYGDDQTGADGSISFRVLTDIRTAGMSTFEGFLGSYFANASYTYGGQTFYGLYTMNVGVVGYSEPVTRTSMAPVTISIAGALPDLDPPIELTTTTPYHYQQVTVTTEVSNIGVVAARDVDVYFYETGVTFYHTMIDYIAPGQTVTVSAIWTASILGQRNISVAIDPFNRIAEFDNNNNGNYTLVTVHGIPDLYVASGDVVLTPSSPIRDQSTTIKAKVHNNGDVSAENVRVSFYATDPSGGVRTLLSDTTLSYIDVNDYAEASISWTPSMAGTYILEVVIDRLGTITEISEANNTYSFEQRVLNFADLRVSYVVFDPASPVSVNDDVSIEASIKNIGDIAATNVLVHYYLGSSSTGTLLDTEVISTIAAGQTVTMTGHWIANIADGQGSDDVYITVLVNPNLPGRVNEVSYTNNEATMTLTVNDQRADLTFDDDMEITRADLDVTHASQGETVNITVTARNIGSTAASGVKFVFYAVDEDGNPVSFATVKKDVGIGKQVVVNTTWTINRAMGNYTILIFANEDGLIEESDNSNNNITMAFVIDAPNAKIELNPLEGADYKPGESILVTGKVTNENTTQPISGVTVTAYLVRDGQMVGEPFTAKTGAKGTYTISLYVPDGASGNYQVHTSVTIGDKTTSTFKNVSIKGVAEGGVPWYLYLVILAVIAAAILFFSVWLYKYGLGKMVECGECGALIPEASKRCPKCGVEFEVGTAKCSECAAWIPSNSSSCPECGAKFINEAIAEEENAYLAKMREQYDAYADTFRAEAKAAMGKKYSDAKFTEWWKKQPSFVSFESWLSQEEEKRKFSGSSCPTCGTLNPRGATICHKCGSTLEQPKVEQPKAEEPKLEAAPAPAEEVKAEKAPAKPLRRIVRRPVEKKAAPKLEDLKPVEGQEAPVEEKAEEKPVDSPEEKKPEN